MVGFCGVTAVLWPGTSYGNVVIFGCWAGLEFADGFCGVFFVMIQRVIVFRVSWVYCSPLTWVDNECSHIATDWAVVQPRMGYDTRCNRLKRLHAVVVRSFVLVVLWVWCWPVAEVAFWHCQRYVRVVRSSVSRWPLEPVSFARDDSAFEYFNSE